MNIRNTATALLFAAGLMFGTPLVSKADSEQIFLPLVSTCQPTQATYSEPWQRPAMLPLASQATLAIKWAKTEGDALKFVDNQTFVIKDRATLTGTGNIDVHSVDIEFGAVFNSNVIKAAAYGYTYHTATKDEPQIVIRAYIKTNDDRFMTLESETHYTALDPALDADTQYNDAAMLINEMVELYAPDPNRYYVHKLGN